MSDDERREVASSLKHCDIVCSGSGRYPYTFNGSVCGCMLVGQSDTAVRAATSFLADLIEPEPERTCRVESSHEVESDGCYSYFEHELTCGHEIACGDQLPPSYCPECGRRVLYDSGDYI